MLNSVELKVEFLMLCHNGNSKEVKKVLKRGWMWPLEGRSRFYPWRRVYVQVASLVTDRNYAGNSAIHIASLSGHLGVVLVLLKHGNVDVNMANNKGETALHIALMSGHLGLVQALLKHSKVDVNLANDKGETAFHIASMRGYLELVLVLLKEGNVDVNLATKEGYTALDLTMWKACRDGHMSEGKLAT